jgi:CBS domain-containing protein
MLVREVMTRGVEVIDPGDTLQEAARLMRDLGVGSLPVYDDRLVGMLTDRDITVRATAEGSDPLYERVHDAMTAGVVFCYEDQDVREAARLMKENRVRRLPVLGRDERLVGIVSLGDLASDAANEHLADQVLKQVSEPAGARHR